MKTRSDKFYTNTDRRNGALEDDNDVDEINNLPTAESANSSETLKLFNKKLFQRNTTKAT